MPAGWPEAEDLRSQKYKTQIFTQKMKSKFNNSPENNEEMFWRTLELIESWESSDRSTGKTPIRSNKKAHRDLRAARWKFLFFAFSLDRLLTVMNMHLAAEDEIKRDHQQ